MTDFAWTDVQPVGNPRLLIGRRPRPKQLEAVRIELHVDTHDAMRDITRTATAKLAVTVGRPYEAFAALEEGEEHFDLVLDEAIGDDADLVRLIRIVDQLDAEDARVLPEKTNTFYAVCWPDADPPVGAVKKLDPARAVKHGKAFRSSDALQRIANPDLILADDADFLIVGTRVGVLKPVPFRQLMSDTKVAVQDVPSYVQTVADVLATDLPLTDEAQTALRTVASKRVSFAGRLQQLATRLGALGLTREKVQAASLTHLGDSNALLDASGNLSFTDENVGVALDLLEGRLFEDDFSGEPRRADRWSRR